MLKRLFLASLILIVLSFLAASVFYPKLYIKGYNPLIYNQVDVYKLNKGLGFTKSRQYLINEFAPTKKETIDFPNRKVVISTRVDGIPIVPDRVLSFDTYFANLKRMTFHKSLDGQRKTQTQQTQVTTTGLIKEFSIDLPTIAMPKAVQKVLGSSAGRLNLDGTQKVTIEAGSTKRKQVPLYETSSSSRFDLKMEQETNLRLSGTIGEKIAVNLKYNSQQDEQLFDPNNVSIKYTGDEDEIIKSIEAGNITLALAGSRYISYSTASQGLFGITSKFKYGDLDLTVIASKEEGQKNTQSYIGTSQADSTIFRSRDYAMRTMYYIADPYDLFDLYTEEDAGPNVPAGWIDNAIKTSPSGAWLIKTPALLPANGSVRLYLDDANASNNVASAPGDTIYISEADFYVPYYDELIEGTDFVTDYSAGIVQINRSIDRRATIAVRYVRQDGIPVPLNSDDQDGILHAQVIRRRNQEYDPTDPNNVWHYQMRNVYNMNKTNIKNDGFNLEIYTVNVDLTRNYLIPDSLAVPGILTYNDYLRMDSTGDGLINGDDPTVNLATGLVLMPFIEPFKPLGDEIVYTDENENISYLDINFYISIKGKIGRDAVDLAQGGILKGSVRVKVNGVVQKENVDYIVDYDFGRITFLTAAGKDPDAKIEIDYEYRSTFEIARKSLAGVRADWNLTDWAKFGGTLIYRSENVADKRPRIGNENIEMLMANVDGTLTLKPAFITRWLDALPLINTSAQSRLTLSGEIAYTIPNIYGDPSGKKNVAYLDDMESIVDSYPMGVTIGSWLLGSKPYGSTLARGRTNWYNPKNIRREQIEDPSTLTDREKKETVTVLALQVFPNNLGMPGSNVWSWGGVMKYLGNQLDFSQKKYIELLVKLDVKAGDPIPNPVMRIDLGDINEDFYTEYGGLNVLNNEDTDADGVLTLAEDIGLDGIVHGEPGADPNDLASDDMDQYGDYPGINGTEGNRVLDTEDLDGNGVLNQLDRYYSYAFSLTDSLYLENINHDGWRLYRIPITDPNVYQVVNNSTTGVQPSLKKISYGRITLETDENAKVLIADLSVVGNKWQDFYIRNLNGQLIPASEINLYNTTYLSGIVNNQKNTSHYTSPAGTYYIEQQRESSESALSLAVQNLQPGHQVLLRQRLFDPYSLLSYGKIKYWVYPEARESDPVNPDSVDIVFRVGADSLNYYQIRQRVPVLDYLAKMDKDSWSEFGYDLQQITALKENDPDATLGEYVEGNTVYSFRGRPTLTNVRDIYFGIYNPADLPVPIPYNGTIYYNDLRVSEPYEDVGVAKRISLNSTFADVSTLDIDYEEKSENFNTVIQRGRSNTFTSSTTLNISNKYFLNKFFPNTWSLDIPINLTRNYTLGIPRFRANSDLLRENILDQAELDRERNENLVYSADFGFSQRNAPRSKILLYTLYRSSLSGRIEKAYRYTPTTVDTTLAWRGTYNYNIGFPSDKVSFKLFKNYRLGFFPTTWNNSFTLNNTEPLSYNWEKRDSLYAWWPRAQTVATKILSTDNNISWGLTSDIAATIRLNSKRDLNQRQLIKSVNVGKLTEYVQDLGLNYNPNYLRSLFNFTASGGTRFSEMQRKYYQNTDEGQIELYQSDGNANRTLRANFTLMNSSLLGTLADKLAAKHRARQDKKAESEAPADKGKDQAVKDEEQKKEEEQQREGELTEEEKKKLEELEREQENGELAEPEGLGDDEFGDGLKFEEPPPFAPGHEDNKPEDFPPGAEGKPEGFPPGFEPPKGGEGDGKGNGKGQEPGKGGSFSLPVTIVRYLSKIKNLTLSYQNGYVMSYTQKDERPPFVFQLGLPHTVAADFLDSTSDDNTVTVGSGMTFSRQLDSVLNYSYTINKRYSNASTQTVAVTFPDLTFSLMDFERWVGLGKYLSSTRLNSGIQYTVRSSGDVDWIEPKQESKGFAFNPLLGFTGTIAKVLSANLSFSMSNGENITDMDTYDIIKTTNTQSLNGNLSYSFRSGRGFTIPFTGRKIHIKNELTSSLGFAYENNYDVTQGRESSQVDRDTSRLSFTPSASYQFDQNIRGGLTGTYELTSDKKRDDGVRTFRIGVWVEVNL
jgi:hypothetical protein